MSARRCSPTTTNTGRNRPNASTHFSCRWERSGPGRSAWAQNNWHKHVNRIAEAQGWRHQLRNEVAFVLYGESRHRRPLSSGGPVAVDFIDNLNFALGTVQTSLGGGGMLRIGTRLDEDFGPPRIRPAPVGSSFFRKPDGLAWYVFFRKPDGLAWYVYGGADLKAVGRDIFLDGNTFRDSRRVDKRWLVSETQAGAVLRYELVRITYSHVWRSEEFLGQRGPSHFGALTIGAYLPLTRP
jgi:lipid A 3-O-deacylase